MIHVNSTANQATAKAAEMVSLRADALMESIYDLRQIKRLANNEVSDETADKIWRLADAITLRLEEGTSNMSQNENKSAAKAAKRPYLHSTVTLKAEDGTCQICCKGVVEVAFIEVDENYRQNEVYVCHQCALRIGSLFDSQRGMHLEDGVLMKNDERQW